MRLGVAIILFVTILFSCTSTREYSISGSKMSSYADCAYMGTFSSVSVITKNRKGSEFNDTLTAIADYVYDSVVKTKVKHKAVNIMAILNKDAATDLTKELTRCAIDFQRNGKMENVEPGLIIEKVADMDQSRYSSYFINYGNIWSKKQQRKYVAGQTLMVTAVVVGVALLVALEAFAQTNNTSIFLNGNFGSGGGSGNSGNSGQTTHTSKHESGMVCVYMIYDKEKKNFCYMKRAEFNCDKTDNNTFNPVRVSEQMDILFGKKHLEKS